MKKPYKQEHPEMYLFEYTDLPYILYPNEKIERCRWDGVWVKGSSYNYRRIRNSKCFKFIGEIK